MVATMIQPEAKTLAQTEAPKPDPERTAYRSLVARERARIRSGVDYLALEANNRSLGAAGEDFVVRFEIARLLAARQERLATRVERVSSTRLSPRHSLHVVNWEGRRLLLGCSDSTIQLLAESKAGDASSSEAER